LEVNMFCNRTRRERDKALAEVASLRKSNDSLRKSMTEARKERDEAQRAFSTAHEKVSALEAEVDALKADAEGREVLTAKHQTTKNGSKTKHRFQVFDRDDKLVCQGPMSKYDTKAGAMAQAQRLASANIVVEIG